MSHSRRAFRALLLLVLVFWSVLLLGWLTLHWAILPHIDEWRPRIETLASRALGAPVLIARIEVRSAGWVPALTLTDVRLLDLQGREALRLPKVDAALSPQSLLTGSLRFSQLHIEGARLEVRRDRQGRLHVGGLDMDGAAVGQDRQAANWFFRQHEFVIRAGDVRWIDEQRDAPALSLTGVDLVVRNSLRHHDLRLDATPPEGWGRRFTLTGRYTQPLLAEPGDWARWSGTLHANLPQVDVASLHRHVSLPFDLRTGSGAFRLWLDLKRGQWRRATLDLALDAVQLQFGARLAPLDVLRLSGRLQAERDADGVQLQARDLAFATADGLDWPAGQLVFGWKQRQDLGAADDGMAEAVPPLLAAAAPITGGEFSADHLDLGAMARIAGRLPLPAALLKALDEAEPEGRVQDLQARWTGPTEQPSHYQVKARLSGLSLAAGAPYDERGFARPGWQGTDFDFQADETGGSGRLRVKQGSLTLPGVFEEAEVALDRFDGKLVWQVRPRAGKLPELEVLLQDARFANADGQGEFQARWQTGAGEGVGLASAARYPGHLTLNGRVARLEATRLARYLPRGLGDEAREYLTLALLGGQLDGLGFKLRGDLWNFPFPAGQEGEFRLVAKARGLNLAYAPYGIEPGAASRWPALTQLNGEVIIDRASLQVRNAQGRLWGLELAGVNGQVRDLMSKSVLVIDGTVRGPLPDLLRFVAESPVGGYLQGALSEATGNGLAELKLGLTVPFIDPGQSTVRGQLSLKGNELRLRSAVPLMSHARGRIDFTEHGFQLSGVAASMLGGDATVEGGSLPDGSLRFEGQGLATAEGLRKAPELGVLARLANRLGGQASYKLQLGFKQGQPELLITSPLVGLSSALPAPLAKAAESTLPLRYQTVVQAGAAAGAAPRDQLSLELGSLLKAQYERDLSQEAPRVLRGALAINDALPSAPPGTVQASFKLGSVNLDQWQIEAGRLGASDKSAGRSGYEPGDLDLQAQELQLHGRRLTQVTAAVQHRASGDGEHWRVNLASDQAQGLIDYRPAGALPGSGRLLVRMSRLAVPPGEAEEVANLIEQASASVPALDIVVDDFELRGKKLGKLEVEASYRGVEGRDWRLSKLNLTLPEAKLTGTGLWAPGQRRRMALDFNLDIADGGGLLERLRLGGRSVRGGKGRIQGQLAWNGSPLAPEWSAMTGQMQLALESGQFLRAEPGAARLLGVLSLQSLPRRFLLDFRDVFQEGFAFDNVSGDVQLADGVASTGNLRIRGVQAVVLMEGQANLRQETQDLRVYVVPELNAGTASLAYATINPVIGLGTFLAQLFLRKPLMEAGTREFRIGGSWSDPTVVPVERKRDARMPDLDPPASSASMPTVKP